MVRTVSWDNKMLLISELCAVSLRLYILMSLALSQFKQIAVSDMSCSLSRIFYSKVFYKCDHFVFINIFFKQHNY